MSENKENLTGIYSFCTIVANMILGMMGLGIGFIFFLGTVVFNGAILMLSLVFLIGAVCIVYYIYLIWLFNRWLVKKCSDGTSEKKDQKRLTRSLIYGIIVLIISFSFSFLRASLF